MKWYVYPDHRAEAIRDVRDASGAISLDLVPAVACFLGPILGQLQTTNDPSEADAFLIPTLIDVFSIAGFRGEHGLSRFLDQFPWFGDRPDRHVLFFMGDNWTVPDSCRDSAVFLPSCMRSGRALALYYPVEDPGPDLVPISEANRDACFQGTITTGGTVRSRLVASLARARRFRVSCRVTDGYFFGLPDDAGRLALRDSYFREIERSRFVFCPRGDGLSSVRFFETIARGRLPILVADEAALPLEDWLPYDQFVVRVPEHAVEDWETYLGAFLATHPDLDYCSSIARNTWKLWFTPPAIGRFVEQSLEGR